jgi:hypothetical protein
VTQICLAYADSSLTIAKKQREEDQAKRDANDRDISEYFTKGVTKSQPKAKVCYSPGLFMPHELA